MKNPKIKKRGLLRKVGQLRKLKPTTMSSSKRRPLALKSEKGGPLSTHLVRWGTYWLTGVFLLVIAGLLSLPNYHSNLDPNSVFARLLVHPSFLFIGFAGLVFLFRSLPVNPEEPEMPRWMAYLWFAFFFGLCFYNRFYHPEEPACNFWYDNLIVTGDIRAIVDFGINHLLFPFGQREPFFPYLTALLWKAIPDATGLWITRLGSAIMDLGSIWGLYLLGRTIRGRIMGLFLMSLWAFSMPMAIAVYFGMGTTSTPLACIWALVFTFRVFQKPTLARFIYWGAAMAFGAYCYIPFRPWTPTLITIVLLWIWFSRGEKPRGKWVLFLSAGLWVSWVFLFFYKNNFLSKENPLVGLALQPWFSGLWTLLLGAAYFKTWTEPKTGEGNRKALGWATGAVVTALLMSPLLLHPLYAAHTSDTSVFRDAGKGIPEMIKILWDHIEFFLGATFYTTTHDVSYYPAPGHSYFDCFSEMAMVLGLAWALARPSWAKTLVLLLAVVGMVPFIFSLGPHTGRSQGAVAPLLLLGGYGLDAFWSLIRRQTASWNLRTGVFLLITAFWGWDAKSTLTVIQTWLNWRSNDDTIGHQLDQDWQKYHVVIAEHLPNFVTEAFTMLCDQRDAWLLTDPNPIYLEPGEKGKDVILYIHADDKTTEERIHKEFPQSQWNDVPNPNGPHFMDRVLITFDSLAETPGKIFYVNRVPHEYWRRRFYAKEYGLCRGLIVWDERTPVLQFALPKVLNPWETGSAEGEIEVPTTGEYRIQSDSSPEVIVLFIDGKKVIDLRPKEGEAFNSKKNIYLTAGKHRILYETTFRRLANFTDIHVFPPDNSHEWILGK